jgi:methyl-accepting chemotaxis protein
MQAVDRGAKKPAAAAKPARASRAANGGGGFTFAMDDSEDDRDADFQR